MVRDLEVSRSVGELGRNAVELVLQQAAADVGALDLHAVDDNAAVLLLAHHLKHRRPLGCSRNPAHNATVA